jgi:hypothetical protein
VSTPSARSAPYPRDREADVVLRGCTLHVRPVRADDEAALRAFFTALSDESMVLRFFARANLDWVTSWALHLDGTPGGAGLMLALYTGKRKLALSRHSPATKG